MYKIMCRVSGGVTGTREAVLKDKNGNEMIFDTERKAKNKAKRMTETMNKDSNMATFKYWVIDMWGD